MQAQPVFDTKPLLSPDQIQSAQEEIKSLNEKLRNPHIEDKGEVGRQLNRARKDFESQVPRPPSDTEEEGRMVARANQLLAEVLADGPCSQEEMRKAPPGAVDKHRRWEKRNKLKLLEWKNIQKRLHVGGDDREAWNFERYRPTTSTLNMDNAQIPGKNIYLPPAMTGRPVVFTAEQIAVLKSHDPKLAEILGSLNNEQRATVKDLVKSAQGLGLAEPEPEIRREPKQWTKKKKHKKHVWSEEARQKARERYQAQRAKKEAKE